MGATIGARHLRHAIVGALALALVAPAAAKPAPKRKSAPLHAVRSVRSVRSVPPGIHKPPHTGTWARITVGNSGDLRPAREAVGRREEPLTPEEETAKQIGKLLRGPLRRGTTSLFVADAKTGEALFAVNADDPMNPASNVKLISTATALELLGPEFRYPTRLLGSAPRDGVVRGNVFLLGSYDPTLTALDLDDIARSLAQRGVIAIEGNIVVGSDSTRDGIYRAIIPIEITGGEPGKLAIAAAPSGADHVIVNVTAITSKRARRARLTYEIETTRDVAGRPRITVTIGGVIGKGGKTTYPLVTRERTATAAYALRAALRARSIQVTGDPVIAELGDFVGDSVSLGALPIELGRHDSARLADIVSRINKRSVNWLADRVIITAAALAHHQPPTMELALDSMYAWLARHPQLTKPGLVLDTGSGLSYRTQITAHELASIVRSAGGFGFDDADRSVSSAWLDSLAVSGTDGTLRHRFRGGALRGQIRGKTGTLSTAIALSGVIDTDPTRPLVFSLITNGDAPLSKAYVRNAHDQVIGELCAYLAKTATISRPVPITSAVPATPPNPAADVEDAELDAALDVEAAATR